MVANFTLLISIGIVLYYALIKPTSQCPVGLNFPGVTEFAIFFGQSIFAFEGIGLVLEYATVNFSLMISTLCTGVDIVQ